MYDIRKVYFKVEQQDSNNSYAYITEFFVDSVTLTCEMLKIVIC